MAENLLSVVLCDAGGFFLVFAIFGIPLGTIADYAWNFIVFILAVKLVPGCKEIHTDTGEKIVFILFMTVLGLVIDWPYFELTLDASLMAKTTVWIPAMPQWLQFVALLMPMAMIFIAGSALAWAFLRLEKKQALTLGAVIGFFTAPWLLPVIPYTLGWVL